MFEIKIIGETKEGVEKRLRETVAMFDTKGKVEIISQEMTPSAGGMGVVLTAMVETI